MQNDFKSSVRILYAEDDWSSGRLVKAIAEGEGHDIRIVSTGDEFLQALSRDTADLILLDLHLPDRSGLELLARSRALYPDLPVIMVTASDQVSDVVQALKGGAMDYLTKPIDRQRLVVSLSQAAKIVRQNRDLTSLRSELRETYRLEHMVGNSPPMEAVRDMIRQAAERDATVLIMGESGTGKELVARALHYASPRVAKPFIDVNCAALTETLIESELFGHERGAFTSAMARRRGKFEQANGGTVFLDEIGEMPLSTQAKVLRVLQERTFQRVGGEENIAVNIRVIAATNRDLDDAVKSREFRLDLLYRINMFVIPVPPLRERAADIPELARFFLTLCRRAGKYTAESIVDSAMDVLCAHDWPGNVRELQNAIERALMVCRDDEIRIEHLPPAIVRRCHSSALAPTINATPVRQNFLEAVEQFERGLILQALEQSDWNKTQAARLLGLTRRVLTYKIATLGLQEQDLGTTPR